MSTKQEMIDELKGLGVDADPKASHAELSKLLKDSKPKEAEERLAPEGDAAAVSPSLEDENDEEDAEPSKEPEETDLAPKGKGKKVEPRLASSGEPRSDKDDEPEDYLRQYQYRKQTEPGSVASDPQPGSKAAEMKARLLKQPKVRIFIPRTAGENVTIKQSVTLNGYRLDFPKQQYLELPDQIADVIMDSQKQTDSAILRGQIAADKQKEEALS